MTAFLIGLWLLLISMIIFIACFMLHCSQHFHLQCCIISKHHINASKAHEKRHSIRVHTNNLVRQIKRNERLCRWCCINREEEFDFFPVSFLLYNILLIIVSVIILLKFIKYEHHLNTLRIPKDGNLVILSQNNEAIDWIICYLLVLSSLWECLFNFYRFYTTYFASRKMMSVNPKDVVLKFALFGVPFLCLILVQIHVYYYLYPLVICSYLIFNVLCVWLFGHILIVQYRFVMGTEKYLTNIHDEMLDSVHMMRRMSFISSISSTTYITIFTLFCNTNILLFIPILWSISCICLALNFVRNRIFLHAKYLSFKLWFYSISSHCNCSCRQCTNILKRRSVSSPSSASASPSNKAPPNIATRETHINQAPNDIEIEIQNEHKMNSEDDEAAKRESIASIIMLNDSKKEETTQQLQNTPSTTITSRHIKWMNAIKNKISTPLTNDASEFSFSPIAEAPSINISNSPKNRLYRKKSASKAKALKVLGIDVNIDKKHKTERSQSTASKKHATPIYAPPTTPITRLFTHLTLSTRKFPDTEPLKADTEQNGAEANEEEDDTNDDDTYIEQRDEFNELELEEQMQRFAKKSDLIRASAQQPHLLMQRISVNLETPPVNINTDEITEAVYHATPTTNKSPFARKKDDEKNISLLLDHVHKEENNQEDEEEEEEQKIMNMHEVESEQEMKHAAFEGNEMRASATKAGLAVLKKMSPKRLKKISFTKRIRSVSGGRALSNDAMRDEAHERDTDKDGEQPMYDNPDVVKLFGVWVKQGFYDNNNVVSAKQLRDYNMNR